MIRALFLTNILVKISYNYDKIRRFNNIAGFKSFLNLKFRSSIAHSQTLNVAMTINYPYHDRWLNLMDLMIP